MAYILGLYLSELEKGIQGSGYAKDFSQSMKQIHDSVRKTLTKNVDKLKKKVNTSKRDVHLYIRDLVMVYLNKKGYKKE